MSVTVTVVSTDRARRIREIRARLARRPSRFAWVALAAVIAVAAVAASMLQSGGTNRPTLPTVAPKRPAGAAVPSAYGYLLGCVSVGVALHDPRFGQAAFDRTLPCVRDLR